MAVKPLQYRNMPSICHRIYILSLFIAECFTSFALKLPQQDWTAIFVPDGIKHTSHYLGVLLKFTEEKTGTNNMFSAASIWMRSFWFLLFSEEHKDASFGWREFSSKDSVKISFGFISEVDLWKDAGKKTLEVKMKSCKSDAFVFCSWTKTCAGQKPQSTWNHRVSLSMLPKLFAS